MWAISAWSLAVACHFVAPHHPHPQLLYTYASPCNVDKKLYEMAGNSASHALWRG